MSFGNLANLTIEQIILLILHIGTILSLAIWIIRGIIKYDPKGEINVSRS